MGSVGLSAELHPDVRAMLVDVITAPESSIYVRAALHTVLEAFDELRVDHTSCDQCGAFIWDLGRHEAWHDAMQLGGLR